MKVEITIPQNEFEHSPLKPERALQAPISDIAIDITQVLQANQALLKNMARKMDALEARLRSLEGAVTDQVRSLETVIPQRLLLMAPPKMQEAWKPQTPKLDEEYFSRFNWLDRIFFPHRMRRSGAEEA